MCILILTNIYTSYAYSFLPIAYKSVCVYVYMGPCKPGAYEQQIESGLILNSSCNLRPEIIKFFYK